MEFRILDIFCGAGGFSYGMHKNVHFRTVVALDFNSNAAHTFKMNMPDTNVIVGDITDKEIKQRIISESIASKVNMIIGGPPCQGFSLKGKKLGLEDPRNFLFREYLNLVEKISPEVFVIENVKTLLTTAKGWFRDQILMHISDLGYNVSFGILKANEFGVPQSRERAIFICSKSRKIKLPVGTSLTVSVRDAIEDLSYLESGEGDFEMEYTTEPLSDYQKLMRQGAVKLYNHKASNHSELAIRKLKLIPAECGKEYLPESLRGKQRFNTTWGRLSWDKVSPTIDTRFDTPSNGTNSHPNLNRAITPREAARLQSFDDKFIFWGSKFYIRTQIGNAVPPLMAAAIANSIDEAYNYGNDYTINSKRFENSLDLDYKKNNGIFYTDLDLANTIVNFLDIPLSSTCIDPCCGTGSFLYALKNKGYSYLYGVEIDEETSLMCKQLTKINEIYNLDSIGQKGNVTLHALNHEAFDLVIGNPPYVPLNNDIKLSTDSDFSNLVNSSGNNLFVGAIYRAFELCKKNGIVCLIIPKNLLHIPSYSKIRRFLLKETTIDAIIELGIHFKTVRGEQIVLICRNNVAPASHEVKFFSHSKGVISYLSQFSQSLYDDKIIVFTNNNEPSLYCKLKKIKPLLSNVCTEPIKRGRSKGDVIRGKDVRKFGIKACSAQEYGGQIFIQNIFSAESGIIASYAGTLNAGETITILNLGNELLAKYVLGLLHSRLINYYLIRFIFNNSRLTIHTDAQYLNNLPIISDTIYFNQMLSIVDDLENLEYMSEKWLDCYENLNQLVYQIYSISSTDKTYIEQEMTNIFSHKWYSTNFKLQP